LYHAKGRKSRISFPNRRIKARGKAYSMDEKDDKERNEKKIFQKGVDK
jgi:hypothetical protein